MSVYLEVHSDRALKKLKYVDTIRSGAQQFGGMGWTTYDIQYRLKFETPPNLGQQSIANFSFECYYHPNPFHKYRGVSKHAQCVKTVKKQWIKMMFADVRGMEIYGSRICKLDNCGNDGRWLIHAVNQDKDPPPSRPWTSKGYNVSVPILSALFPQDSSNSYGKPTCFCWNASGQHRP